AFCAQNQVPLDFVSTHTYGVNQGFLDEFGTTGTVLSKDEQAINADVQKSRREIQQSALPKLELHYTEWSSSYTPADPTHDSYHQPAYILQKLKQVGSTAQSMSYWVFSDIFEEAGPRFEAFHGGFGLMNTQGIKKPAYFAYQFLNELSATELQNKDAQSLATTDAKGNVQLLLWDYTRTLPEGINNQQYFIKDLPAKSKGDVLVQVNGLRQGSYVLSISQVGYKRNDAYTAYIGLAGPRSGFRPYGRPSGPCGTADRLEKMQLPPEKVVFCTVYAFSHLSSMNRRLAVKHVALLAGAAVVLPSCFSQTKNPEQAAALQPAALTASQQQLVADVCETLIPRTDTPGAKDLGLPQYVLKMLNDCTPPKEQQVF
nr:hypothetical protein [Tanacetum cinerariifolium]